MNGTQLGGSVAPKISILMTTYNHERFVAKALDSVLDQQHEYDFEIVVGDDASTDGTKETVLAYQRRHPDVVRFINRPENVGHCRNYLGVLEACRGEYVAILDGDDCWTEPRKLAHQIGFLDSHPDFALSCHRFLRHYTPEDRVATDLCPELYVHSPAGFVMDPERFFTHWVALTSTVVLRRSTVSLDECRGYEHFGDVQLFFSVLRKGRGYAHGFVGAVYNVHGQGIWSKLTEDQQFAFNLRILDELAKRYPDDRPLRRARAVCRHRLLWEDHQRIVRGRRSLGSLLKRGWTRLRLFVTHPGRCAWLGQG